MTQRAYEWDPRPPTKRERIICGFWLVAFVTAMANYYAGWQLFRGYDKWVFGGLLLGSLFLFARLPGVRRTEGVGAATDLLGDHRCRGGGSHHPFATEARKLASAFNPLRL